LAGRGIAFLGARTFASLRNHRNFRLYFGAHAISFTGTWMQQIAIYWLVLELTGSPVAVGVMALAQMLPVTGFVLFAGTAIDRLDVRRVLIAAESVGATCAVTLAVLTLSGLVETWHLYVVAAVNGAALVFQMPARHTLLFRIVGREDLANAVALSSALGTLARIAGPAIGGGVVAVAGSGIAFAANAGTYGAVIGCVLWLRVADLVPVERAAERPGLLGGAWEAIRFAFSTRRTTIAFVTVLLVSTFAFNFDVLTPLLARTTLDAGAEVFGLLAAVFGAGALTGALLLATLGRASVRVLLTGAAGFGALELVLAFQDTLVPACLLLFAIGVFYIQWGSNALSTLQLAAPPHLRARAASLYFWGFAGGAPLGGVVAGWLVSHGGTRLAYLVAGTAAITVASGGALALRGRVEPVARPALRALLRRP
jgi:MFS family permease